MVFIKRNKYLLFIILGIVSMALMIPNISDRIRSIQYYINNGLEVPARVVFNLVQFVCIFLAEIMFIIMGARRRMDKYIFLTSVILYYASTGSYSIYRGIVDGDYSVYFSVIMAVLCIVTVFMALYNPRYQFTALIILLIDLAFHVSETFTGSTVGLSSLILSTLLIFSIILYKDYREDDLDSNIYS